MTNHQAVVVPAIPPRPPQLSLLLSAVRPGNGSDPESPVFEIGTDQLALLPDGLREELSARRGDAWVRGITYAPENHWPATVRDACDGTAVDQTTLTAPLGLATAPHATGGSLASATYSYQVTAVNANGETTALAPVTGVVVSGGSVGSVTLTWNKVADNARYRIYGRTNGSIGLLAIVGPFDHDQAATYIDTGTPAPGAVPPSSNTTGGPGSYTNLPIVTAIPYAIRVQDSCSSFGFSERDFKGRALRLLENATPQAIERELWTGALAQAAGYPNNYLTGPATIDVTPGSVPSVARGLQILQDSLQQCGFGGQGMIHVQAQTAPNLLSVRRVGNLLLDLFDNIVVPGVGYPGTGPGGVAPDPGFAWMYATDLVMVRAEDEGRVFPDSFAEALDRGQGGQPNRITFEAQKFGVAYFDGACQFGCKVALAT